MFYDLILDMMHHCFCCVLSVTQPSLVATWEGTMQCEHQEVKTL